MKLLKLVFKNVLLSRTVLSDDYILIRNSIFSSSLISFINTQIEKLKPSEISHTY